MRSRPVYSPIVIAGGRRGRHEPQEERIMPNEAPHAKASREDAEPPYAAIVVITGVIAVVSVAIVAMFQYPEDATMVVTALGPVIGVIGTLVGAYFGLRGSSLSHQKAVKAEIRRAEIAAATN
jgi:hypothetical protein